MADANKPKILAVAETPRVRDFILDVLVRNGYSVKPSFSNNEALKILASENFDLIVVESGSAEVDGLSFCRSMRVNSVSGYTAINFISNQNDTAKTIAAMQAGADDFWVVGGPEDEFLCRVQAMFIRAQRCADIHPLTRLFGASTAVKELVCRIQSGKIFAVAYADLYNFRRYNDRYGFKRGDDVLQCAAGLFRECLLELGGAGDFLAHCSGDDFLWITSAEAIDDVCKTVIEKFSKRIPDFYDERDRAQGYITVKNRKGEVVKCPFLWIHIGVATNQYYKFTSPAQIMRVVIELKDYAHQFDKSIFIRDRRRSYPFY